VSNTVNSNGSHAERGSSTSRRRRVSLRATLFAALAIVGCSLLMSACSIVSTSATCSPSTGGLIKSSGSTLSKGVSSTTLPPSHDNDVGKGRIPDSTPDADVDANQRPHSCKGLN
jgi:hypothetical protein